VRDWPGWYVKAALASPTPALTFFSSPGEHRHAQVRLQGTAAPPVVGGAVALVCLTGRLGRARSGRVVHRVRRLGCLQAKVTGAIVRQSGCPVRARRTSCGASGFLCSGLARNDSSWGTGSSERRRGIAPSIRQFVKCRKFCFSRHAFVALGSDRGRPGRNFAAGQ
jgi:hypothetical protein